VKVKSKMYLHNGKESSVDDFFEICNKYGIEPTEDAIKTASYVVFGC
jgi:predicted HicB family RNase H-like nuclease